MHDPAQNTLGLLGRVPRLFTPSGRDDRVPPDVSGELSALGLFGCHEARGHVRFAVHFIGVEEICHGILDIHQNGVVLGGPTFFRLGAIVIGPDDLIEKTLTAKKSVQHDLRVMCLSIIQVQIESAVVGQQAPGLTQSGLEKTPVVIETIVVTHEITAGALIGLALETGEGRCGIRGGQHARCLGARLFSSRIERRINVDEGERGIR